MLRHCPSVCPYVSSPEVLNGFQLNFMFMGQTDSCRANVILIRTGVVGFPAGAGNFSVHLRFQTGSRAHPASYPMGTRSSNPGGKAAGS